MVMKQVAESLSLIVSSANLLCSAVVPAHPGTVTDRAWDFVGVPESAVVVCPST